MLCGVLPAYAANGAKLIGCGAVSAVMGGTGCAEGQDTGSLVINPANVTAIGRRIDVASEVVLVDGRLDTSAAANPVYANTYGEHTSGAHVIFIPHLGCAVPLDQDGTWYAGFAASVVSGLEVDYKKSRRAASVTNNEYDRHVRLFTYEFVPTIGYKPCERVSLGFSPVAALNRLEADIANASLKETVGHDNGDHAWGIGFNAGMRYELCRYMTAGFSFKSMRWHERFDAYNDTLEKLDSPPEYIMGIALKPTERMLIETNVKYIHWRWVDKMRKAPDHGGYGWNDQWVTGLGVQYRLCERLHVRAGYNYGESPIESDVVYANGLSPLVSEHHVGIGFGLMITKAISLDTGWVHIFKKNLTENGAGDAVGVNGRGSRIRLEADSLYCGLSYRF
jgi:long-chain fatty acid transport protein